MATLSINRTLVVGVYEVLWGGDVDTSRDGVEGLNAVEREYTVVRIVTIPRVYASLEAFTVE
jgi:hypothetical protein